MEILGGKISVTIDNKVIRAKGDFVVSIGGSAAPKRKVVNDSRGKAAGCIDDVSEPGYIEGKIMDGKKVSLVKIGSLTGASIKVELANGKTYAIDDAVSCNPDGGKLDLKEGEIMVRFEGDVTEVGAE